MIWAEPNDVRLKRNDVDRKSDKLGGKMDVILQIIRAFFVGGALCMIAQILIDRTKLTPARILVSYVVAGVILGAVGLYKPLVDFAGAGATVPLTGFGYLISDGIREAVDKQGLLGALTGGLTAAAGGISAALIFGYLSAVVFKGKRRG